MGMLLKTGSCPLSCVFQPLVERKRGLLNHCAIAFLWRNHYIGSINPTQGAWTL